MSSDREPGYPHGWHECQCLIIYADGSQDPCPALVGRDQPFCVACDKRHLDYATWQPSTQVTVRRPRWRA